MTIPIEVFCVGATTIVAFILLMILLNRGRYPVRRFVFKQKTKTEDEWEEEK